MSNVLYHSFKGGYPVTRHSYSAGQTFRGCRRRYQLEKLNGWKEREHRASMEWGNAVEAAVQYLHINGCKPGLGVDEFKRLWLLQKGADLTYSAKEGDWADLYQAGAEMLALYEVKWPSFGYTIPDPKTAFQRSLRKEVFPGTALAGLEFVAYVDLLAEFAPRERTQNFEFRRPIIIDIKTSAAALDDQPGILQLDPQLRSYAWVSSIPDVAFLWMQKFKPGSYRKGDEVSVLLDLKGSPIGTGSGIPARVLSTSDTAVVLLSPNEYERFEKEADGLRGKELAQKKTEFEKNSITVLFESVTKQRISFVRTTVSPEAQHDAGEIIGQQIADIHAANLKNSWPQDGAGIRWPNDDCKNCPMLGVCLGDEKLIDTTLIRPAGGPKPAAPASNQVETEDWLGEI